jgi:hypothetical protein
VDNILFRESIDTRVHERECSIELGHIRFLCREESGEFFTGFFEKSREVTIARSFFFAYLESFLAELVIGIGNRKWKVKSFIYPLRVEKLKVVYNS